MAIWGEAVSNKALLKNKVEIASHPSDARNDSKKYLIFKWLYQLLDFYRYFWGRCLDVNLLFDINLDTSCPCNEGKTLAIKKKEDF
ncbi:hypothetical protein [Thermodesulfovibrio hydrogeniphilus]